MVDDYVQVKKDDVDQMQTDIQNIIQSSEKAMNGGGGANSTSN